MEILTGERSEPCGSQQKYLSFGQNFYILNKFA